MELDHHIIDGITLAGLTISILGSFFFAYHVLGENRLRTALRYAIPAMVGGMVVGVVGFPIYFVSYQIHWKDMVVFGRSIVATEVSFVLTGMFIGVLTTSRLINTQLTISQQYVTVTVDLAGDR